MQNNSLILFLLALLPPTPWQDKPPQAFTESWVLMTELDLESPRHCPACQEQWLEVEDALYRWHHPGESDNYSSLPLGSP